MTKTELLELIQNGESSFVEFKRDEINNRDLVKELVALSNSDGGRVLLGVEDDGTISGVIRNQIEEWVMTASRDKIRPPLTPSFEIIKNVQNGKDIAVVSVESSWTVHNVWHNQHATYYIRVGTQSREADTSELQRLFQRRGTVRFETQPVSGTTVKNLSRPRLVDYFARIREQDIPSIDDSGGWVNLLHNTELLVDSEAGNSKVCSVAGLLLFGTAPQRFLPHATVDVAVFPGVDRDYNASFRDTAKGPLVSLHDEQGDVVEPGVINQVINMLQPHLSSEKLRGSIRIRKWRYPLATIREAVVNAAAHRDYLLSATNCEVSVFENRIEITSPGRPPNQITPERMRVGCRASRNQILKDVLRDYGYMEHIGMGIPRKIIKLMREKLHTNPDLIIGEESFSLILKTGK